MVSTTETKVEIRVKTGVRALTGLAELYGPTLGVDSTNLPQPPLPFLPFPAVSQCADGSLEAHAAQKG